jgi:AraC-like DNA-binding protein
MEDVFLQKLRLALEARLSEAELSVDDICRAVGMGRSNLYAKLSALTGLSFNLYLRSLRLHQAKTLLETTELNVSEIAYEVGFSDPKYFSRVFSEQFGTAPRDWRRP